MPKYNTTNDSIVKIDFENHDPLVTNNISITQGPYHGNKWKLKLSMKKKWMNATSEEDIYIFIKNEKLYNSHIHS